MKHFIITAALIFATSALGKNSFMVAPTRMVVDLKKTQTKSLIVSNTGDSPVRISISPKYYKLDDKGYKNGEALYPEKDGSDDISKMIRISPRTVSIKPGAKRHVRISVRPDKELKEGEYRAHILFKMLEVAQTMKSKADPEKDVGMEISFKFETAVAVYGRVGNGAAKLSAECSLDKDGNLNVLATNSALWRFDGNLVLPEGEARVFMVRESKKIVPTKFKAKTKEVPLKWVSIESGATLSEETCQIKSSAKGAPKAKDETKTKK